MRTASCPASRAASSELAKAVDRRSAEQHTEVTRIAVRPEPVSGCLGQAPGPREVTDRLTASIASMYNWAGRITVGSTRPDSHSRMARRHWRCLVERVHAFGELCGADGPDEFLVRALRRPTSARRSRPTATRRSDPREPRQTGHGVCGGDPAARSSVTASASSACRGRYQPRRSLQTSAAADSSSRALPNASAPIEHTVQSTDSGTGRPATARAASTRLADVAGPVGPLGEHGGQTQGNRRPVPDGRRVRRELGRDELLDEERVAFGTPVERVQALRNRPLSPVSDVTSSADSALLSGFNRSSVTPGTARHRIESRHAQPAIDRGHRNDRSPRSRRPLPRPPSTR